MSKQTARARLAARHVDVQNRTRRRSQRWNFDFINRIRLLAVPHIHDSRRGVRFEPLADVDRTCWVAGAPDPELNRPWLAEPAKIYIYRKERVWLDSNSSQCPRGNLESRISSGAGLINRVNTDCYRQPPSMAHRSCSSIRSDTQCAEPGSSRSASEFRDF